MPFDQWSRVGSDGGHVDKLDLLPGDVIYRNMDHDREDVKRVIRS